MKSVFETILKILSYSDFLKQITEYIMNELAKAENGNKAAAARVRIAQVALDKRNKEHRRASLSK
jgi:hypothetical protein